MTGASASSERIFSFSASPNKETAPVSASLGDAAERREQFAPDAVRIAIEVRAAARIGLRSVASGTRTSSVPA